MRPHFKVLTVLRVVIKGSNLFNRCHSFSILRLVYIKIGKRYSMWCIVCLFVFMSSIIVY